MPKNPCRFKEVEVARALRAAERAGQHVSTIHIGSDGEVTLHVAQRDTKETEERPTAA